MLVLGAAQLHEELRGRIADGTVFRFAHKPASAERLKLLLLAALRTRPVEAPSPPTLGRMAGVTGGLAGGLTGNADEAAATLMDAPGSPGPRWLWPLLLSLTALGAMVVGWYASSVASQRHLLP
jgi:hypothetical protein